MTAPLVVVGDALLDRDVDGRADRLCPDAPAPVLDATTTTARPGGAALAAALAATGDRPVVLLTALGGAAGVEVARLLDEVGVAVVDIGLPGATPEKVRFRAGGQVLLRHDLGGAPAPTGPLPAAAADVLRSAAAVLVADYGRGVSAHPGLRALLAGTDAPLVWDPHPRGAAPTPGATLVTPNAAELLGAAGATAVYSEVHAAASDARARWRATAVAATLGRRGALLVAGGDGPPLAVPARRLDGPVDTCGAGDRFASAAALGLADGAVLSEAVVDAVAAATAFVAAGGASAWRPTPPDDVPAHFDVGAAGLGGVAARLDEVRRRGGTVVATGGCFDLFHAGHLHLLRAAAALGDALVVCVNSDASVRALKGPDRPVVPQGDRLAVLAALECVDEVVCFDEATPVATLEVLRPDVFVKGGDYTGRAIAEADVLARWGGQTVTVPYLGGRSTTKLVAAVRSSPTG